METAGEKERKKKQEYHDQKNDDELEIDTNAFEARSDKKTCVCWLHTSI